MTYPLHIIASKHHTTPSYRTVVLNWGYINRGYKAPKFLGMHTLKFLKMCCWLLWVQ